VRPQRLIGVVRLQCATTDSSDDKMYDVVVVNNLKGRSTPIKHKSMADSVSEQLRTMILSRKLEPGLRVTQVELAEMLGVSTMPIREALLRLVAEGLIVTAANRSFEVATTTERGIRDVYWIHGVLAGELAARAWDNKTDALLGALLQEHANSVRALKSGDFQQLTDSNRRFHAAINTAAESPTTNVILRNTLHYFPDFSLDVAGWRELAIDWQSELIDQFDSGDREQAKQVSMDKSRAAGELFIEAYWSNLED
jgi:DNA-binding GntR family transcriptional regulator